MTKASTVDIPRMTRGETRKFRSMQRRGYLILGVALFLATFLVMTAIGAGGLRYAAQWLLALIVGALLGLVLAFLKAAQRVEQRAILRVYGSVPRYRPTPVTPTPYTGADQTQHIITIDPDSDITRLVAGGSDHSLAA